jgi:regulator of sigma E protease
MAGVELDIMNAAETASWVSWVPYIVPAFLFVLTIVIFIHELGHFLVARWCGVKIDAFSIGFGPELLAFVDRHGTRWRIAWIPLGGYVKFIDDENVASVRTGDAAPATGPDGAGGAAAAASAESAVTTSDDAGRFHSKPLWQRAAVVVAGPVANFLLAFLVFGAYYTFNGERVTIARVDKVLEDGAAATAGFQAGDIVTAIDGVRITSFADMQRIVSASADHELTFVVDRNGEDVTLKATPGRREQVDRFGNRFRIGMIGIQQSTRPEDVTTIEYNPVTGVGRGMAESWFIVSRTFIMIRDIVTGREDLTQLGGPIKIAALSGQILSLGFERLIYWLAAVSVMIGLFNLFPIPVLDGGNLLFYAIEAIRGHPLSERAQAFGFRVGLAVLGMLMVFVITNDFITEVVMRLFG